MLWNSGNALKKIQEETNERNNLRTALYDAIHEDAQRCQFTPDYNEISLHKSKLLFVHNDFSQLQPNHDLIQAGSLSGFYPLTYGYTTKKYSFVKKDLGLKSFPIALSIRDKDNLPYWMADEYRIRGEIYAIRPQQFLILDTAMQNGVQFRREKVNINIGFQRVREKSWVDANGRTRYEQRFDKEEMISHEIFMYVGREDYWKDQLEAGFFDFKPIPIITEDRLWLKEYYQYSRVR